MKKMNRKGFTIVELVIVIAIVAVLAAILIPTFATVIKKADESAYLQDRTNQQIADLAEKVNNQNYLSWEDFEAKLAEKLAALTPAGETLTPDEIKSAIEAAIAEYAAANANTALTEAQVKTIVEKAVSGQLTTAQVQAIVDAAVTAIKVQIPEAGLSTADVEKIVNAAIKELQDKVGNVGITKEQMQKAINDAINAALDNQPTAEDIQVIVNKALEGFANEGLTKQQVEQIVNSAINGLPTSLTAEQVQAIVDAAIAKLGSYESITKEQMQKAINDAINEAISKLPDNPNVTTEQIQAIVDKALEAFGSEQLTPEQLQQIIQDAIDKSKEEAPDVTVTLDKTSLEITAGETAELHETVTGATGVTWSSSNTAVATVCDGVVTAKKAGTAVITVTTLTGAKSANCVVTVKAETPVDPEPEQPDDTVHVESVVIELNSYVIEIGDTIVPTVTVTPENATNKNVYWTTSDPTVAGFYEDGTIVGISEGTAEITVTSIDGGKTYSCTVTVKAAETVDPNPDVPTPEIIPVTGITLNKNVLSLTAGAQETLFAAVFPVTATNKAVIWSSSDTSVAIVTANGTIITLKAGTAAITATAIGGSNISTNCVVIVSDGSSTPSTPDIPVTGINLSKTSLELAIGNTEPLTAQVIPANATNAYVFWSSTNTSVVTVNNGLVTAVGAGTATVRAVVGNIVAECQVTVPAPTPDTPTIPADAEYFSTVDELKEKLADSSVSYIVLANSMSITETIEISREVTLDLNGKVISANVPVNGLFVVTNDAIVTIKNGVIDSICADDADNWVEGKVIDVENATLTIDALKIFARGAEDGTDMSGIELGENASVIMNDDSLIQLPGASSVTENGNVTITYGGQYAAIRLYGEDNSSFTMNGGTINVIGTGCKYAIQDLGGGSNNTITLNGGTIHVENQGDEDTDYTAVFELRGSVSSIVADGVEIVLKGTGAGNYTFLNSRYTAFKGTIEYKGTTKITVTNCAKLEQKSTYASGGKYYGGTFLVTEGTYSDIFATWTADGYTYTAN